MNSKDLQEQARKKVQAKKGLFIHLGVFVITGFFFFVMNLVTMEGGDDWWFYFPMIPWSVGMAIHYMVVMGIPGSDIFSSEWEEREYEKYLEELEWRNYRNSRMKLPERIDEEGLELKEFSKSKSTKFDDEDFV